MDAKTARMISSLKNKPLPVRAQTRELKEAVDTAIQEAVTKGLMATRVVLPPSVSYEVAEAFTRVVKKEFGFKAKLLQNYGIISTNLIYQPRNVLELEW